MIHVSAQSRIEEGTHIAFDALSLPREQEAFYFDGVAYIVWEVFHQPQAVCECADGPHAQVALIIGLMDIE